MNNILTSPLYYITLTLLIYLGVSYIYKKTKFALFNPLLLTAILIICYLLITNNSSDDYNSALSFITAFLSPLTVCLAIPVFNRINIIKQYKLPIIVGTIVGSTTSVFSSILLGKVFGLTDEIIRSILAKSVTTPIAIEICNRLGGIEAITITVVILTGIFGAMFGPLILKILNIKRSPAVGMSLGGTSHAVGTSKAVEISARAGAIASVAIVTSGILTVIISLFL